MNHETSDDTLPAGLLASLTMTGATDQASAEAYRRGREIAAFHRGLLDGGINEDMAGGFTQTYLWQVVPDANIGEITP